MRLMDLMDDVFFLSRLIYTEEQIYEILLSLQFRKCKNPKVIFWTKK